MLLFSDRRSQSVDFGQLLFIRILLLDCFLCKLLHPCLSSLFENAELSIQVFLIIRNLVFCSNGPEDILDLPGAYVESFLFLTLELLNFELDFICKCIHLSLKLRHLSLVASFDARY